MISFTYPWRDSSSSVLVQTFVFVLGSSKAMRRGCNDEYSSAVKNNGFLEIDFKKENIHNRVGLDLSPLYLTCS